MDFSLTEDQKMLKSMVRDFAQRELEPVAAGIDDTEQFPADLVKKMAALGLMGLTIPEQYGGGGRGKTEFCLAIEELSRVSASVSAIFRISLSLAIHPIVLLGTDEQKRRFLVPHASGDKLACFALTEAGAGSNPAAMATTARRQGDGYVLNGSKLFASLGDEAELALVFATVDRSLRQRGITAFIVEKGTPGFSVGKHERKMGMHGVSAVELIFQDCLVPGENRLGEEGRGLKIALETLNASRITVGAEAVGISQGALDAALSYARRPRQSGKPIADFQAIQWLLVDMATQIDAARLLTYRAAYLEDSGLPFVKEAAMAKLFASEVSRMVTNNALQIHGGYGYTKDCPVERYLRDARVTELYEGTSEIMRLTIARDLI
ncbi:MAG: acyl-CoA dehydrogenase family protein [Dehalococcoidales bacterium]